MESDGPSLKAIQTYRYEREKLIQSRLTPVSRESVLDTIWTRLVSYLDEMHRTHWHDEFRSLEETADEWKQTMGMVTLDDLIAVQSKYGESEKKSSNAYVMLFNMLDLSHASFRDFLHFVDLHFRLTEDDKLGIYFMRRYPEMVTAFNAIHAQKNPPNVKVN